MVTGVKPDLTIALLSSRYTA